MVQWDLWMAVQKENHVSLSAKITEAIMQKSRKKD